MGYSYHTNFFNGWESSVLKNANNKCHCNPYGDPSCCMAARTFYDWPWYIVFCFKYHWWHQCTSFPLSLINLNVLLAMGNLMTPPGANLYRHHLIKNTLQYISLLLWDQCMSWWKKEWCQVRWWRLWYQRQWLMKGGRLRGHVFGVGVWGIVGFL